MKLIEVKDVSMKDLIAIGEYNRDHFGLKSGPIYFQYDSVNDKDYVEDTRDGVIPKERKLAYRLCSEDELKEILGIEGDKI